MNYKELKDILFRLEVEKVKVYREEFEKQDLYYVSPWCNILEELEKEWEKFNTMTKPFRRKSDWIHLEYIGITNEEIYNLLKSNLLEGPIYSDQLASPDNVDKDEGEYINYIVSENSFIPAADNIEFDRVFRSNADSRKMKLAKDWMKDT